MIKRIVFSVFLLVAGGAFCPGRAAAPAPAVEKEHAVALRYTKHARQRMIERGVAPEVVAGIVASVNPFSYYHQGRWKTGYYDPDKKIFIATDHGLVITVITDATPHYVAGLKRKKP